MNFPLILKTLGALLALLGVTMLIPVLVSLFYSDGAFLPMLSSAALTLGVGTSLYLFSKSSASNFPTKSAFLVVTGAWFFAPLFGALPFYLTNSYPSFVDAWFESASGFTTTGASVMTDIESLPESVLLWRSMTQFLGGMGIVVLSLAVLPLLGVGGMDLFKAEAPGPTSDKISARVSNTARALWIVYIVYTVALAALLGHFGMSVFDAINHSLTTMATGGFSTKNSSIAAFDSPQIDFVITLFMFFAGVNFIIHYRAIAEQDFKPLRGIEFRFYTLLSLGASLILAYVLWGPNYDSFQESLRYSGFQVVSLLSSTGFGTADYILWGAFGQGALFVLMFIGGSAGSTAGGIKCIRVLVLFKQAKRALYQLIHPKAVLPLKVGRKNVSVQVANSITGFFVLYMALAAAATLGVSSFGVDLVTSFSAVISSLSNIGPGLGEVGPTSNYAALPDSVKLILSICMLIGRLEIMTVFVLCTREFWTN